MPSAVYEEKVGIEKIRKGDYVASYDELKGKKSYKQVTELFERKTDLIFTVVFSTGEKLETTWNHPFWIIENHDAQKRGPPALSASLFYGMSPSSRNIPKGKWIPAKDLKPGQKALTKSGTAVTVTDVRQERRSETVYNFAVKENHTYYVGQDGVLVHNEEKAYAKGSKIFGKKPIEYNNEELDLRIKLLKESALDFAIQEAEMKSKQEQIKKKKDETSFFSMETLKGIGLGEETGNVFRMTAFEAQIIKDILGNEVDLKKLIVNKDRKGVGRDAIAETPPSIFGLSSINNYQLTNTERYIGRADELGIDGLNIPKESPEYKLIARTSVIVHEIYHRQGAFKNTAQKAEDFEIARQQAFPGRTTRELKEDHLTSGYWEEVTKARTYSDNHLSDENKKKFSQLTMGELLSDPTGSSFGGQRIYVEQRANAFAKRMNIEIIRPILQRKKEIEIKKK